MALPDDLLGDVRNYLDITWTDEALDNKIKGFISRGAKYIDGVTGEEEDYTIEDKPKELLLDYCRYARSHALEDFQKNFRHELLSLQIQRKVERANEAADV